MQGYQFPVLTANNSSNFHSPPNPAYSTNYNLQFSQKPQSIPPASKQLNFRPETSQLINSRMNNPPKLNLPPQDPIKNNNNPTSRFLEDYSYKPLSVPLKNGYKDQSQKQKYYNHNYEGAVKINREGSPMKSSFVPHIDGNQTKTSGTQIKTDLNQYNDRYLTNYMNVRNSGSPQKKITTNYENYQSSANKTKQGITNQEFTANKDKIKSIYQQISNSSGNKAQQNYMLKRQYMKQPKKSSQFDTGLNLSSDYKYKFEQNPSKQPKKSGQFDALPNFLDGNQLKLDYISKREPKKSVQYDTIPNLSQKIDDTNKNNYNSKSNQQYSPQIKKSDISNKNQGYSAAVNLSPQTYNHSTNKYLGIDLNSNYDSINADTGKTPTFKSTTTQKLTYSPSPQNQAKKSIYLGIEQPRKSKTPSELSKSGQLKSQEPTPRKQDQISYTKYLLLQMKKQDLQKQVTNLKQELQNREKQLEEKQLKHRKQMQLYQSNSNQQKTKYQKEIRLKNQLYQQQRDQYEKQLEQMRTKNRESLYQNQKSYEQKQKELKQKYEASLIEKERQIKKLFEKLTLADQQFREQIRRTQLKELLKEIQVKSFEQAENLSRIQSLEKELQINENQLRNYKEMNDKTLAYSHQLSRNLQQTIILLSRTRAENPSFEQTINTQLAEAKLLNKKIEELQEQKISLKQKLQEQLRNIEKLHNEYKFLLVKQKSERYKEVTQLNMALTNKDNEIKTLTKKLKTIQERYRLAVGDNKNKDQFIYKYLVNKCAKSEEVPNRQEVKQSTERALSHLKNWLELNEELQKLKEDNNVLRNKLDIYGL